jgi:spore coat protein H
MKYAVIFACCLHIGTMVFTQETAQYLDLTGISSHGQKDIYNLEVNAYCESKLQEISGEKFKIPSCKMTYNDIPLEIKSCKIRGHSTLYFKRKSFSIALNEPVLRGGSEIKKLALNCLSMDRHYYRNRLSFLLMEQLDIFPLQNNFAELRINGHTAGLYLEVQKPEDFIRAMECPLLVRREYEGRYTMEYSDAKDSKRQIKRLRKIPKLIKELEGKKLYDSLNAVIDMNHYFKWLAFNYIVKNGDYTDELFLYLREKENRFDIIPWDYDDIFRSEPHDGFEKRNKILDHQLLFSAEAVLDIVIDRDEFLYLKFLNSFQEVLEILTPDVLKDAFEQVFWELYPYYSDQELISQSESDSYGLTTLGDLKTDLLHKYQATLSHMKSIGSIIDAELKRQSE